MDTDSTVVKAGDFVIRNVKSSSILTKDGQLITENISPLEEHQQIVMPLLVMYGVIFLLLTVLIGFLGWYYLKKRSETARLMVQNNISPATLFGGSSEGQRSISKLLKFGIILIALGLAVFISEILATVGLSRYEGPVFILMSGFCLILIHILNSRLNKH